MGVTHKLKPEIIKFILDEKKADPALSCRALTNLVKNKYQIKISKSSINSIIKKEELSSPVGRRQKKRRKNVPSIVPTAPEPIVVQSIKPEPMLPAPVIPPPVEIASASPRNDDMVGDSTGEILLKAVDYLMGGSYSLYEEIKNKLNYTGDDLLAKTESLIFMPLYENVKEESLLSYLNELQNVKTMSLDLLRVTSTALEEVRCIKVNLSDGSILYLDGQLHTVWSTPHIPHDFSTTLYSTKSYINKYFFGDLPFIFFTAPGYDIPTKEFFNLISSLDTKSKKIIQMTLYDNNFEELEVIPLDLVKEQLFTFGVWPWQFVEHRKVKKLGEFKPLYLEELNMQLYVAEIEIQLTQPNISQSVMLKGCAIKTSLAEKTRLIVLSSLANKAADSYSWLSAYLSHWPNFEEAFHDYSRKIELFTYTGTSRKFFSAEILGLGSESAPDVKNIFQKYLEALDMYLRLHFLPAGYENQDFPTTKERFFNLKAVLKKEKNRLLVSFKPAPGYQYLKDLEYACRRLNEREIVNHANARLWFTV